MPDQTFPPSQRFHHGRDYGRVMHRQQKAAGKHAVVLVAPRKKAVGTRIGIMVSTKVAAKAVRRHQIKRWVREYFRTNLKLRSEGFDVVVLLRRDPPVDGHAAFDQEVGRLFDQATQAQSAPRPRRPKK